MGRAIGVVVEAKVKNNKLNKQTHQQSRSRAWAVGKVRMGDSGETSGQQGGQGRWRFPRLPRALGEAHSRAKGSRSSESPCGPPASAGPGPLAGRYVLPLPSCPPAPPAKHSSWRERLTWAVGLRAVAASRCWRHGAAVLMPTCSAGDPTPSPSCLTPASAPDSVSMSPPLGGLPGWGPAASVMPRCLPARAVSSSGAGAPGLAWHLVQETCPVLVENTQGVQTRAFKPQSF